MGVEKNIMELENYIGFPIKRNETKLESNKPHDETFSYGLCQRFYNKDKELKIAIKNLTNIIIKLENQSKKNKNCKRETALLFSLLGDMYYLASDFSKSINCFMKALNFNKEDITNWVGLMFSLRAYGEIDIFENLIFNFEDIYYTWKKDTGSEMNQEKIYELMRKIKIS
jgi:tetratricopeptide (TPR) repeat protein